MASKMRKKFIGIASLAVFIVLLIVLGVVNIVTTLDEYAEIDGILDFIDDNNGIMPDYGDKVSKYKKMDIFLTEESRFENRYFTIFMDDNQNVTECYMENIAAITEEDAAELADAVYRIADISHKIGPRKVYGTISRKQMKYSYKVCQRDNGSFIIFLDTTQRIRTLHGILIFSLYIGLVSMMLFLLILIALSSRVIKPMIESHEKQKEFITNAGHELKTPISIISANTEVIEMTSGKNEWTESTMNQVKRLSGLINDLITLARMEEASDIVLENVDYSKEAAEVADSFESIVKSDGKTLDKKIEEGINVKAEKRSLHTLVNILVDNAVKYCDDEGYVSVSLTKKGKQSILQVANSYKDGANVDCNRFFDRFYREDESHNSDKKGYGIGLSMAKGIVDAFGGKISVSYNDGIIMFTVNIPTS